METQNGGHGSFAGRSLITWRSAIPPEYTGGNGFQRPHHGGSPRNLQIALPLVNYLSQTGCMLANVAAAIQPSSWSMCAGRKIVATSFDVGTITLTRFNLILGEAVICERSTGFRRGLLAQRTEDSCLQNLRSSSLSA
jgi:hypothetical protein